MHFPRNRWRLDDHGRKLDCVFRLWQHQLALPRQRAPGRQVVGLQPVAPRYFIHRCAWTQALGNDPCLDLIWLLAVSLTVSNEL